MSCRVEVSPPAPDPESLIAHERRVAIALIAASRGQESTCARLVAASLGLELPGGPQHVACGELSLLGIGPGRWLAMLAEGGHSFAGGLTRTLADCAAVNDVSDAYVIWQMAGPLLRDTLANLVSIDVHEREFPVGRSAQTVAAHMGVSLWRLADSATGPTFALAVARSYSVSFREALEEAAGKSGIRFESG